MLQREHDLLRSVCARDAVRRLLTVLTVASLAAGCAISPGSTASPDQAPSPTQNEAPSPAPSLPSSSRAEATSPPPALHLVAVGDSIAAAMMCQCARYPDVYGQRAAKALGQPVRVQNMAVNGATSADLLDSLGRLRPLQMAIHDADFITITMGINDIGRCTTETDRACYDAAIAGLKTNLEAILDQIDTLQGDHRHVLRETAYDNFSIGSQETAQFGPSFQAFYADQLASLNATICAAVAAHDGLCVDLLTPFNGPAGDQDAAPRLLGDHVHPSRTGNEVIADAIAALGYAPLGP